MLSNVDLLLYYSFDMKLIRGSLVEPWFFNPFSSFAQLVQLTRCIQFIRFIQFIQFIQFTSSNPLNPFNPFKSFNSFELFKSLTPLNAFSSSNSTHSVHSMRSIVQFMQVTLSIQLFHSHCVFAFFFCSFNFWCSIGLFFLKRFIWPLNSFVISRLNIKNIEGIFVYNYERIINILLLYRIFKDRSALNT